MGCGSWTSADWSSYSTSRGISSSSTASTLYTKHSVKDEFEPKNIKFRESCDSEDHPNSTPIILGLDVTGSMGSVLETVCKKLNTTMTEILERNPVDDPQIMFLAFGDTYCDSHPLQATQFESDIRIAEQLNDIYFECGGGGNGGESYALPWYFAARHTKIDSFDKHNKKGFLFTIGDEECLPEITKEQIKQFIDDDVEENISAEAILAEVSRKYEVYHLIVDPVAYQEPQKEWKKLLGKNVMLLLTCYVHNDHIFHLCYYQNGFLVTVIARLPKEIIMIPIMTVMFYSLVKVFSRVRLEEYAK